MHGAGLAAIVALAAACSTAPVAEAPVMPHPFVGCWDSADGFSREGWTIDPSSWLIGYSATRNAEGEVTFFEFMRVERGDGPDVLVVSGGDDSKAVRFTREITEAVDVFRFVNEAHDYPQVITYLPTSGRLDAKISRADGTSVRTFPKAACKG